MINHTLIRQVNLCDSHRASGERVGASLAMEALDLGEDLDTDLPTTCSVSLMSLSRRRQPSLCQPHPLLLHPLLQSPLLPKITRSFHNICEYG